jgi:predicted deacylase
MLPPLAAGQAPGTLVRTQLCVEDPESGQQVRIPFIVARGAEDGPTLCLLAAQRGLDMNGTAALHLALPRLDLTRLSGTVIGAPVANPPAARIRRQAFPGDDGWPNACLHDMNTLWPGDAEGTLAERMVAAIWEQCIESAHAVIDLHSSLPQRGAMAVVRATSDASMAGAKAFGLPHVRVTREVDRRALYDVAARQGKAAIEVRLPPPGMIAPESVRQALSGIRSVLSELHMTDRGARSAETALVLPEAEVRAWHAPTDGVVLSHVDPGSIVQEGALIAELLSVHTAEVAAEAVAPFRGVVTLLGSAAIEPSARPTDLVSQGELYAQVARCDL